MRRAETKGPKLSHPSDGIEPVIVHPERCFTREQARRWAIGWTAIRYLVDGHPDDANPKTGATKWNRNTAGNRTRPLVWPRLVAHRLVREWTQDDEAVKKKGHAPVDEAEARALVTRCMFEHGECEDVLFTLEAIVGAEPILDAAIAALEQVKKNPSSDGALFCGFLLLRVPPAVAKRQRARLEALYQSLAKPKVKRGKHYLITSLDLMLHGAEAVERNGLEHSMWSERWRYAFCEDPAILLDHYTRPGAECPVLAWSAWYAGPEVLPLLLKANEAPWSPSEIPELLEQVATFADPRATDVMAHFLGNKAAGDVPLAWMRAHPKLAKPRLAELAAEKGKVAATAKKALAAL